MTRPPKTYLTKQNLRSCLECLGRICWAASQKCRIVFDWCKNWVRTNECELSSQFQEELYKKLTNIYFFNKIKLILFYLVEQKHMSRLWRSLKSFVFVWYLSYVFLFSCNPGFLRFSHQECPTLIWCGTSGRWFGTWESPTEIRVGNVADYWAIYNIYVLLHMYLYMFFLYLYNFNV